MVDNPEELLRLRLARQRCSQIEKLIKKQKLLDTAARHTQYGGWRVGEGAIARGLGGNSGIFPAITNGLILPGQQISKKGAFIDAKPHYLRVLEEEEVVAISGLDVAILYVVDREVPGLECALGTWIFNPERFSATGRPQQLCNVLSAGDVYGNGWNKFQSHLNREDCENNRNFFNITTNRGGLGSNLFEGDFIFQNQFNASLSQTSTVNSGQINVNIDGVPGASNGIWIRASTPTFRTYSGINRFRFRGNFQDIPGTYQVGFALGVGQVPSLEFGGYGDPQDFNYQFDGTSFDSGWLDMPNNGSFDFHIFYYALYQQTPFDANYPAIGNFSIELDIEEDPIPAYSYYCRPASEASGVLLAQARKDDSHRIYFAVNGTTPILHVKAGILENYNELNQSFWYRTRRHGLNGLVGETFYPDNFVSPINWQSDFIAQDSEVIYPLEIYSNPWFDFQSNLVDGKYLTCDRTQLINGIPIVESLKTGNAQATIEERESTQLPTDSPGQTYQVLIPSLAPQLSQLGVAADKFEIKAFSPYRR